MTDSWTSVTSAAAAAANFLGHSLVAIMEWAVLQCACSQKDSCSWRVTSTPLYFADNGMFGEGVLWWVCLVSLDQDKPVQDLITESGVKQNFS